MCCFCSRDVAERNQGVFGYIAPRFHFTCPELVEAIASRLAQATFINQTELVVGWGFNPTQRRCKVVTRGVKTPPYMATQTPHTVTKAVPREIHSVASRVYIYWFFLKSQRYASAMICACWYGGGSTCCDTTTMAFAPSAPTLLRVSTWAAVRPP